MFPAASWVEGRVFLEADERRGRLDGLCGWREHGPPQGTARGNRLKENHGPGRGAAGKKEEIWPRMHADEFER